MMPDAKHINIAKISLGDRASQPCNGFSHPLSGAQIAYHSSHPLADTALISRASKGENVISWQTGKLYPMPDGLIHIHWLGGIASCQGGPHTFYLRVGEYKPFELKTCGAGEKPSEILCATKDLTLYFRQQFTDMFGDHFGIFELIIKPNALGQDPITLEITGEEANSRDWLMVFCYPLDGIPRLKADPVIALREGHPERLIRIWIDSFTPMEELSITTSDSLPQRYSLNPGVNLIEVPIPLCDTPEVFRVSYNSDSKNIPCPDLHITPITPREVHILPFSHNDIGYTHLQPEVITRQCANLDQALILAEQSRDYPDEAKAKWNLEVLWALEHWWDQADEKVKIRLKQAVHSGQIGLNALYANPLTGMCNEEELAHHFDLARKISALLDYQISTCAVTDIPGFVWTLQTAMYDAGLRYFAIAPNAGDRTGHLYKGLGDKPFYWVSPDGDKPVLTWVMGASYSLFHRERITTTGIKHLLSYLERLDEADYPYSLVALPYTIGGDNGGPDEDLARFVNDWNAKYLSPRLVISTHEQLFSKFAAMYGDSFPRLKGDMTPYWEDGAGSTAEYTALARQASDRLLQAEAIYRHYAPQQYNEDFFYHAWQQIVLWDEHTWGAWNSVSDPDLPFVKQQWEIKKSFALSSDRLSREHLKDALGKVPTHKGLTVINTNPFPIEALVTLEVGKTLADTSIATQQTPQGEIAFIAELPAGVSHRDYDLIPYEPMHLDNSVTEPWLMLSKDLHIELDPKSGCITSIINNMTGMSYLSKAQPVLELCYLSGLNPRTYHHPKGIRLIHRFSGELFETLSYSCELQGMNSVRINLTLHHHQPCLEIELIIDKQPIREKESLHLAFPFSFEDAVLRYDSADCGISPEIDQLPGSCKNFFSPTGYVDVSNHSAGVTVTLLDAPLIEVGEITAELPWIESLAPSTTFYSYILNNYWHTNYKADQEGIMCFRYALLFHSGYFHQRAKEFSLSKRRPPVLSY